MTTADHTPSRACYLRGCRREECSAANYRYMSRYRLYRARNGHRRVPTGPIADHVHQLIAAGWSANQIATTAQCSDRTIISLKNGAYATIRADIATRILAAQPKVTIVGSNSYVDATGTIRRVRALIAIGHPLISIAAAVGVHKTPLGKIVNHEHARVTARLARAVTVAYADMSKRPGTSQRARNDAQRKGWHGPLSWDDIDNPNEQPETDSGIDTRHKAVIDLDLVARRTAQGKTAEQIATEIGCHKRSVVRARRRAEMGVAA